MTRMDGRGSYYRLGVQKRNVAVKRQWVECLLISGAWLVWLFLAIAVGGRVFAAVPVYLQPSPNSNPNPNPNPNSFFPSPYGLPGTSTFGYGDVQKLIEQNKLSSVENLLEVIPQDYRTHYAALYFSRSLQEASFENPRVILFGSSSRFMMSFNGGPEQKGFNRVEMIEFKTLEDRFEFRELTFTPRGAKLSEANPPLCLQCHQHPMRVGVDPRPNWEPYNVWPGVFGAADASPAGSLEWDIKVADRRPGDVFLLNQQKLEYVAYRKWDEQIRPNHSRYKYLARLDHSKVLSFTDTLSVLNFRRMQRLMNVEPIYQELFRKVMVHLARCNGNLVTPEISLSLAPMPSNSTIKMGLTGEVVDFWVWQFFGFRGVLTEDWSMDFGTYGRFAFTERFGVPSWAPHRLAETFSPDPLVGPPHQVCPDLRQQALAALQELAALKSATPPAPPPATPIPAPSPSQPSGSHGDTLAQQPGSGPVSSCLRCHQDQRFALDIPQIPLDQPAVLKRILDRPRSGGRGTLRESLRLRISQDVPFGQQMPPDKILTPEESKVLLDYINRI